MSVKNVTKRNGSESECDRRFKKSIQSNIYDKIWVRLVKIDDDKRRVKWISHILVSISIKSPLGSDKRS